MKSDGVILCRHLWKICLRGQNLVGFFEENIRIPLFKNLSSLGGGRGGGGVDKKKNVPVLALYFAVYKSLCIYV